MDNRTNTFCGVSYPSQTRMLEAMVIDWITADGKNSEDSIMEAYELNSCAELADEMIHNLELINHMEKEGYTHADLESIFSNIRHRIDSILEDINSVKASGP